MGTAEIFEAEHGALFQLSPPHRRSVINLLASGICDVRDGLKTLVYAELDGFHARLAEKSSTGEK